MTALRSEHDVRAWLDLLQATSVIVISPHLDDAVFSVGGVLSAARGRAEVVTVFTEARAGQDDSWARLSGFADCEAEHKARREEDALAMNRLGCRFRHLGLHPGQANQALISQAAGAIQQDQPDGLERTLVLLPGGAGGPTPTSRLERLVQRLSRRPWGCMPHGEHELTRDLFWHAWAASPARIGFYAEIPYAWSQSNEQLQQRLHATLGCQTEMVEYSHNNTEKQLLVELYPSQMQPIFGSSPAYRRRVLARKECLFLAKR